MAERMYLTESEAQSLGLPSNQEQIARHNERVLYEGMNRAEDEFHAAVVRQFGKNRAEMRYQSSKHNPETRCKAEAFWLACKLYLDHRESMRAEGVR
jgi:hypothetical protein